MSSASAIRTPSSFRFPRALRSPIEKQTHIVVSGADKAQVGQVAADIRTPSPAGSLQAEGHPHHRRASEEEGGQDRRENDRLANFVARLLVMSFLSGFAAPL